MTARVVMVCCLCLSRTGELLRFGVMLGELQNG